MTQKKPPLLSRRDALLTTATAALSPLLPKELHASAASAASGPPEKPLRAAPTGPGHVVRVHMPNMRQGAFPHPQAARIMVEKAVATLSRQSDSRAAWRTFVHPSERVMLKINCLGTRMVSTMKEVTDAVIDGLQGAGVPPEHITVVDMFASNMMGGRYEQRTAKNRVRVLAHRDAPYESQWVTAGKARVKFSTLFTESDVVINLPVIKDHDLSGVTCCMKNVTFGVVEKPHVNHNVINDALCHIWALEAVRSRVRLNIIDGSTILYDGGPKYNRAALVPHESIYATTDPVAMDAIAHQHIAELRAQNGLRTLAEVKRPPMYIQQAADMGLGIADPDLIALETIELPPFSGAVS